MAVDMLVRLYDLPALEPLLTEVRQQGLLIRRADPWERTPLLAFVRAQFSQAWADEISAGLSRQPFSVFVAEDHGELVGFAAYHCTRLNYFGPEGVREDYRGRGLGRALLLCCLGAMGEEGYGYAVIGAAGPQEFYHRACGATPIEGSCPGVYGSLLRRRARPPAQ